MKQLLQTTRRIAVIGAGVSGNVAARLLHEKHHVELFEAQSHAGGHAETVDVQIDGRTYPVDMGFMVFNDHTYPQFRRILDGLRVQDQASDMSFSVQAPEAKLEYQGSSLNGLFAQRSNLFSPRFYGLLREILRFNRLSQQFLQEHRKEITLSDFLSQHHFLPSLVDHYLVPMTAAIWSAPPRQMLEYPAYFLLNFLKNHGLLQIWNRPQWRTIQGGSRNYVAELLRPLLEERKVHLNSPVQKVKRNSDSVRIQLVSGEVRRFDLIVLALHADQALRLLIDPSEVEQQTLSSFPYQSNLAILHTDVSVLPKRRRAWASWNYHAPADPSQPVSVTYDVNRLQRLGCPKPILVTLNPSQPIHPDLILKQVHYQHPLFTSHSITAQERWHEINGTSRTYYCGAYWGHGFHEDGVQSAIRACNQIHHDFQQVSSPRTETSVSGTSQLPDSLQIKVASHD